MCSVPGSEAHRKASCASQFSITQPVCVSKTQLRFELTATKKQKNVSNLFQSYLKVWF